MNLFNNDDTKKKTHNRGRSFKGGFEEMMAEREKHLPAFQEKIEDHFKHYNCEMTALITIEEDENGNPTNSSIFVGGVASAEASMKMLKALDEAKDAIIHQMAEGISENPEALDAFLGDMLTDMIKKTRK